MKTLQRYIMRELFFPFVMGLTIFTFILVMDRIFTLSDLIVEYGVSVWIVLKLLIFILPATFAITIPMACLVAVIVVFSRLKSDNEIMAMKASGISPLPLLKVLLAFGVLLTVAMAFFNNTILPEANFAYRHLYYDIVRQRAAIVIREHVFIEDFDGYVFRVDDKNPVTGELKDIVVFVRGAKSDEPVRTIMAKKGQLISDQQNRRVLLKLENGYMQVVQKDNRALFSRIDFATTFLDLDIHRELADSDKNVQRGAREMSMRQIQEQIKQWSSEGKDVNLLHVEYHKKFSIPFACLAFILIGAPAGILAPRSGRYFSYFIAVALIFLYYIFISLGETFGADGRIDPFLSMWLPNFVLTAAGLYGLAWVLSEKPPFFPRTWRRLEGRK
ncbi:LPS export ABC transporter permease LptF [candidate division FCPU426 bacterium]|nr:LPS export ABC transporter permease LptF [candidate division FCPU426 bacterium]